MIFTLPESISFNTTQSQAGFMIAKKNLNLEKFTSQTGHSNGWRAICRRYTGLVCRLWKKVRKIKVRIA